MDIKIAIKHLRRSFSSALLPLPFPLLYATAQGRNHTFLRKASSLQEFLVVRNFLKCKWRAQFSPSPRLNARRLFGQTTSGSTSPTRAHPPLLIEAQYEKYLACTSVSNSIPMR